LIKPRLTTTSTRLPDTNRTRLVRKAKPTDSFFNFFSPPVPPTDEAIENGDIEEEDLAELEEKLEVDYQIGEDLKEKVRSSLSGL
jgi:nucleosome assembly protein 1-like 1